MQRHPARYTHTDTLFPYTTLCRSVLGLAGAASAAPAGNRRLALVDRVPPRPDQRDRDRGEQEQALQFQRPATLVIELARSEERRVGKEWVSTCRSRWSPYH